MSPIFSYSCLLILFLSSPPCVGGRRAPESEAGRLKNKTNRWWYDLERLIDARRGIHASGITQLKKYFHRFGYLTLRDTNNVTDKFDAWLESAVTSFQAHLGLPVSGMLDSATLSEILLPRCGVPDNVRHYVFFPGRPRWARRVPVTLTYSFSPHNRIDYLSSQDIRQVFKRAFARWSSVIPVGFSETNDYGFADIKIGFYSGDHGDGEPFDGVLGVLAHAFSPESGKFHLDADERWAVDFGWEKSKMAVDLESVATHEIGHVLGLGHTWVKGAVMYPSLKPRIKKLDLVMDDIVGVQALYGSNPNYSFPSDISSNHALHFMVTCPSYRGMLLLVFILNSIFIL